MQAFDESSTSVIVTNMTCDWGHMNSPNLDNTVCNTLDHQEVSVQLITRGCNISGNLCGAYAVETSNTPLRDVPHTASQTTVQ